MHSLVSRGNKQHWVSPKRSNAAYGIIEEYRTITHKSISTGSRKQPLSR